MLADFTLGAPGHATDKIFSDIADIEAITSLPMEAPHRSTDNAVISRGLAAGVPTAILCPPTIVGVGKGPVKKRSIQVPWMTEAILKRGKTFSIGPAENWWDFVHVDDLADALILLTEKALDKNDKSATWGKEGYYFVETAEFVSQVFFWLACTDALSAIQDYLQNDCRRPLLTRTPKLHRC